MDHDDTYCNMGDAANGIAWNAASTITVGQSPLIPVPLEKCRDLLMAVHRLVERTGTGASITITGANYSPNDTAVVFDIVRRHHAVGLCAIVSVAFAERPSPPLSKLIMRESLEEPEAIVELASVSSGFTEVDDDGKVLRVFIPSVLPELDPELN